MTMEKNLEKRMYMLVPYQLNGIQKAIQAGHAALEYAHKYGKTEEYIDFIENWKTWIILNGGTTNNSLDEDKRGTLNSDLEKIIYYNSGNFTHEKRINYTTFNEPDLNDALTAICLVVDERVFNRKDYPDFKDLNFNEIDFMVSNAEDYLQEQIDYYVENYLDGDYRTYFLKELLNNKKLALN